MSASRHSGYVPQDIEPKWQKVWTDRGVMRADDNSSKPKFYDLVMYPYPSGDLTVGHARNYVMGDVLARMKRMQGFEVLHPFGWDAFGLPAENAAMKRGGIHPETWTIENIAKAKRELKMLGILYDWDREVTSCMPDYYRWTEWLFLLFYERGLAYRAMAPVNWCPVDKTVLANEQVINGRCWRHLDVEVEKRDLEQWFFKITDYADRLLDDLELLDKWPHKVRLMQTNWIGRSQGAEVEFPIVGLEGGESLRIYTTRPDTLFGATFMVLAPEHPLVERITTDKYRVKVREYVAKARKASDIDRLSTEREKSGVPTGAFALNPVNGEKIPIWVADYVLMTYGTGAIIDTGGDRAAHRIAARAARGVRRAGRDGEQRGVRRSRLCCRDRARYRRPGGQGPGEARGQVPAARLADLPPALLGKPDPDRPLRGRRSRASAHGAAARAAAQGIQTAIGESRLLAHDLPQVRARGAARDGHDGHVHRFLVVLPALREPA